MDVAMNHVVGVQVPDCLGRLDELQWHSKFV